MQEGSHCNKLSKENNSSWSNAGWEREMLTRIFCEAIAFSFDCTFDIFSFTLSLCHSEFSFKITKHNFLIAILNSVILFSLPKWFIFSSVLVVWKGHVFDDTSLELCGKKFYIFLSTITSLFPFFTYLTNFFSNPCRAPSFILSDLQKAMTSHRFLSWV